MKKQFSALVTLALIVGLAPFTNAQTTRPSFSAVAQPAQNISTAQPAHWTVRLKNAQITRQTRALVIMKDTITGQRFILAAVRLEPGQNEFDVEWKADPEAIEQRGIDLENGLYRLSIRARIDGQWARGYSTRFRLNRPQLTVGDPVEKEEAAESEEETVTETEAPAPASAVITSDMRLVARYSFTATLEPWEVRKLTIVNDLDDDGFDYDPNEAVSVVKEVALRYPDLNGNPVEVKRLFSGTRAVFENLKYHIPRNESADVEIWASIIESDQIDRFRSGQVFQLGIQTVNNFANSFEAIGLVSNRIDNFLNELSLNSQLQNNEFIVRKTQPVFEVNQPHERVLTSGKNDVFEFTVTPSNQQPLSLARLVFNVTQNDVSVIDQVELFRSGTRLNPGDDTIVRQMYLVWDTGGASCFAHTTDGMDCAGGTQNLSKLIVTFSQPEIINGPTTYRLRLNAQNVSQNASLQVGLDTGDEETKPSLGGDTPTNGFIFNNSGVNELFAVNTSFINEATSIAGRSVIWSDRTALGSHAFPAITPAASPAIDTGSSADFTNGYRLKINQLPSVNSVR